MCNIKIKKKRILVIVGFVLICAFIATIFFNRLTITNYSIETNKVNESIRIVLLADLHSCVYGKNQKDLISMINEQNPDLILMVGDIADDELPIDGTIDLLNGISNSYECFYVTGNHEFWSGEVDSIKNIFREYGVRVLEGESEVAYINGQSINICGVDDPDIGEAIYKKQLENAFSSINENLYTILLSHRPERFEEEAIYNCDLILAGHAHGGQWRIPHILNGLLSPNQGFFPKYTSGIYSINEVKMLVSRGLSRESTMVPRIFNPPEVVVIDIVSQ